MVGQKKMTSIFVYHIPRQMSNTDTKKKDNNFTFQLCEYFPICKQRNSKGFKILGHENFYFRSFHRFLVIEFYI